MGLGLDYEETEEDVSEKVVTKQTPVNGIKIYEVKQEVNTLEDAFFEKTGGNVIE